jgi:DNA-binding transcriptional MerR regulator
LAQISIKTLHYYDELGLLKPARVDAETGYRYYSVSQLPRLHRIMALRDLGFPLDRIAEALEEGVGADELRGMLMLRRVEQENRIREESDRLDRLKATLRLIEDEGRLTGDVVLKRLAPQWIVSVRETIPAYREIGALFGKLLGALGPPPSEGVGVALLHDTDYRERDVDVEVGIYLQHAITVSRPLECYSLPAAAVASVVHHGAFSRIAEAYSALLRWIEANKYCPAGPTRELFLRVSAPVRRDDESNVTEIQVPVSKNEPL